MSQPYIIDHRAESVGNGRCGEFVASYAALEKRFGPPTFGPEDCFDGKVSSEWVFRHVETGAVFTVYDYKATDSDPTSVAEFRAQPSYAWHVGGKTRAAEFIAWISAQVGE